MNSRGRHNSHASESNIGGGNNNDYRVTTTTTTSSNLNPTDHADLESFKAALKELTFNSRPIIEKLTGMARERARSIPGQVARAILDSLVFNNPKLRSCFLFLIDSICKNVGEPYPTSFVKHGLVSAYLRVYGEIWSGGDEGQKRDFLRVLPTWNGVIPAEALKQIEVKLGLPISTTTKNTTNIPAHSTTNPIPSHTISPSTPLYSQKTLKLLKDLQGVFEKPPGPHISGIVSEIFRRLAQSGELKREVLGELDFKAKMGDKGQIIEALKQLQVATRAPEKNRTVANETPVAPSTTLNFELPPNFQIDLSLLSSIVELNKLNTNALSSSSLSSAPQSPTKIPVATDKHFIEIPVNSADLLTTRPNLHQILYADLSLQCKTCAIRFRDTPRGQERMTEHLDSHFRRNMRIKEKSKRVMARDWFGSEEDWIAAKQDSEAASERAVNIFEDSSAAGSTDPSYLTHATNDVFVEASEEEQGSAVKCDVCQEIVDLLWNDDTEQWTFPACVRNEFGNILHANCQTTVDAAEPGKESKRPPSKRSRALKLRGYPMKLPSTPHRKSPIQTDYKEWKIILKNDSAQQLVLYNESDRSLQVHGTSEIDFEEPRCCGECGRPWPDNDIKNPVESFEQEPHNQFMDKNYFRLLDISSRQQQQVAFHQSPLLQYVVQPEKPGKKGSKLASHQTTLVEEVESPSTQHPKNLSDSSINQGYYKRFFNEGPKLGRGSGGSVFKCQHMLDGIELGAYAVKKVPVGDDHSWLNRMLREVHILENLRHSNIIEYKHAWLEYHQLTPFGPPIPCLFILMQLAEGGNLEEFVLNNKATLNSNLNITLYCEWFEQICLGLAHLHQCGILHRDLKPSNILIKMANDRAQLLITDFGECTTSEQSIASPADHNRTGATGTIEFVAPELLKVDRKSGQYMYQQSKSTDIWSLGLIFYFMLTGKLPYPDIDDLDVLKTSMTSLKQVVLPKEVNKLPKGFRKALGAMLQVDPELRPSIEQVLILIKDSAVTNHHAISETKSNSKQLIFPSNNSTITPQTITPTPSFDENARISLALIMICISVIPTYPSIPSFRRIILALAFTFSALKTTKQRSAIVLLTAYTFLIIAFYFNKID